MTVPVPSPADHAARGKAVALTIRDQAERQCARQAAGHRSCEEAYAANSYANRCSRCAVLFVASQLTGRAGHVTADHAAEALLFIDGVSETDEQRAASRKAVAALVAQAETARELIREATLVSSDQWDELDARMRRFLTGGDSR